MSGNRLAVAADDPLLGNAVQTFLKKNGDLAPLLCSFGDVRDHLGRDTDGVLILALGFRRLIARRPYALFKKSHCRNSPSESS